MLATPFARRSVAAQARVICARAGRAFSGRSGGCREAVEDAVVEYLRERRRRVS